MYCFDKNTQVVYVHGKKVYHGQRHISAPHMGISKAHAEKLKLCSYMQTGVQQELQLCSYMQTCVQ